MKEYILVIISGILKAVEKKDWQDLPDRAKFEKDDDLDGYLALKIPIEVSRAKAFEGGALVEFENLPTDIKKHVGEILLLDFLTPTMLEVDPSKWEVVEQWEYKSPNETRIVATIKPKENSAHGYTEGSDFIDLPNNIQEAVNRNFMELLEPTIVTDSTSGYDEKCYHECPLCNSRCNCFNTPCSCCNDETPQEPTRKLVTEEILEWLVEQRNTAHVNCLGEYKNAMNHAIVHVESLKAKEIDNIRDAYVNGQYYCSYEYIKDGNTIPTSSKYITQTYQTK